MDHGEILLTLAEVSVAFAGFAGVVAVFGRREPGTWSFLDRVRFFSLVHASLSAFLHCIVPFGLLAFQLTEAVVWRWSSGLFVVNVTAATVLLLGRIRAASTSDRAGLTIVSVYVMIAMLVPILALNVQNVVASGSFGPFLAGLIFLLAYCSFLFARMLISSFAGRAV